jgi:hypothetical protein
MNISKLIQQEREQLSFVILVIFLRKPQSMIMYFLVIPPQAYRQPSHTYFQKKHHF